ncbi:MAG: DM13 domain-containing protein [Hydrogenophaga sp.]
MLLTGALAACGGGSDGRKTTVKACGGKTSAKVGKTFNFSTLAHNLSGTATVIDDCTIELTRFNCDGGGLPDVYGWGGMGGEYRKGFRIGGNLFGVQRSNATERVSLQAGDLDKLDGISIWCERAGASFGDGIFR